MEELRDLPVAVAAKLARQLDDHFRYHIFILSALGNMPLHRSVLSENSTCPSPCHPETLSYCLDAPSTTLGAQKLPFAASWRIILSNARS